MNITHEKSQGNERRLSQKPNDCDPFHDTIHSSMPLLSHNNQNKINFTCKFTVLTSLVSEATFCVRYDVLEVIILSIVFLSITESKAGTIRHIYLSPNQTRGPNKVKQGTL